MLTFGIDIGATTTKFGIVETSTGSITQEWSKPTPQGNSGLVADLVAAEIIGLKSDIRSLGVGVPGAMDADRTIVRNPPNLVGWKEEPLKKLLETNLPEYHIEIDNDAKVATLAEARFGSGKGVDNFLLATLGTGVGGGLWL